MSQLYQQESELSIHDLNTIFPEHRQIDSRQIDIDIYIHTYIQDWYFKNIEINKFLPLRKNNINNPELGNKRTTYF